MSEPVVQRMAGQAAAWIYEVPERRGKMHLLTVGCVSVTGDWKGELGEFYLAWSPLLKRDKEKEAAIVAARKGRVLDYEPKKVIPILPACGHGTAVCNYPCFGKARGHCSGVL